MAAVEHDGDAFDAVIARRGEDDDQHGAGLVLPLLGRMHRPVRVAPFDVEQPALADRRAARKRVPGQRGMVATRGDGGARECDQPFVGLVPIDPGACVILGIGVVVAMLREAELRAHREHRRAARDE